MMLKIEMCVCNAHTHKNIDETIDSSVIFSFWCLKWNLDIKHSWEKNVPEIIFRLLNGNLARVYLQTTSTIVLWVVRTISVKMDLNFLHVLWKINMKNAVHFLAFLRYMLHKIQNIECIVYTCIIAAGPALMPIRKSSGSLSYGGSSYQWPIWCGRIDPLAASSYIYVSSTVKNRKKYKHKYIHYLVESNRNESWIKIQMHI